MLPGGGLGGLNVVTGGFGPFGGAVAPIVVPPRGGAGRGNINRVPSLDEVLKQLEPKQQAERLALLLLMDSL